MQFGIKSLLSTVKTYNKVVSYGPTIHSNSESSVNNVFRLTLNQRKRKLILFEADKAESSHHSNCLSIEKSWHAQNYQMDLHQSY